MHWSAYEIFSVISGIVLVIGGFVVGGKLTDRLWMVGGGVAFVAYGCYVASQDSGTWGFPVWVFVIPVAAVGWTVAKALGRSSGQHAPARDGRPFGTEPDGRRRDDGAVR